MIVAKKNVGNLQILVHDWSFCTMYRDREFHHHSKWSPDERALAQDAIDEANERRAELPTSGLIQLEL